MNCKCQNCPGEITFPSEDAGQTVICPHCQMETMLFIPPPPKPQSEQAAPPKLGNKRTTLFVVSGLIIVTVIISVAVFIAAIPRVKDNNPTTQKPDQNLQEVKGALGWNLGDVLPNNLEVKIDDDIYGITYGFEPPVDMEKAELSCHLVLTEDRRIAAICTSGLESNQFNRDTVKGVLKEKYGLRRSWKLPWGDRYDDDFGQTNCQAVLTTTGQSYYGQSSLIYLEYRDERLCKLAEQQQENRKAAANRKSQNNLKGNF